MPIRFEEGVGVYLCEAFAAGCPAVEPNTGSFPEIMGDAGLLYQPNDASTLADALEKLLCDTMLYENYCHNARQLSLERYNDQLSAEQLFDIYKSLNKEK